jgi:hypothetical protein
MQLLIDSTQETPASLRFIAATLCALADTYGPPIEELLEPKPSINGPSSPIVLHTHTPAAPIDPAPLVTPVNDPGQMDPAAVFGRSVPAGTIAPFPSAAATFIPGVSTGVGTVDPTLPASSTVAPVPGATVPAAPVAPTVVAPVADSHSQTPVTPVADTAFDKNGMAWDVKVHSESKALNADGTWRFRRNLDAAIKAAYLASITGAAPLAPAAPPAPAPEAPPAPIAPVAPQPPTAPLPVSNGVPLGVSNTQHPPAVQALGFRDFMSAVNKALAAGRLTQDQLTTACKAANLDGISALASEPGRISLVHNQIAHLLGAATA